MIIERDGKGNEIVGGTRKHVSGDAEAYCDFDVRSGGSQRSANHLVHL